MMLALAVAVGLMATDPLDVEGVWYTENNDSQVEITRDGDSVTGAIIWYRDHDETIVYDTENKDEAARNREILGLQILEGFEKGDDKWRRGEIYDPTDGKTYRSAIFRIDDDTLGVQGCVGFICLTQEWSAVPPSEVTRVERAPKVRSGE